MRSEGGGDGNPALSGNGRGRQKGKQGKCLWQLCLQGSLFCGCEGVKKTRMSLEQFGFLVEQACLLGGFDDVRGQDVAKQQGRGRVVPAVVLQRLAVVFVGVAVAASVRAGVVVPQSAALHAGASFPVAFMGGSLEVDAQGLAEYLGGHAAAALDAILFVFLGRGTC